MRKKEFTGKWITERLGAQPSRFDPRNLKYMRLPTLDETYETPEEFDGLDDFSPTNFGRNQGSVGTCVGWDWNIVYETCLELFLIYKDIESSRNRSDELIVGHVFNDMSAGWAYQQSRKYSIPPVPDRVEGSTNFGAVRAAQKLGICTELLVPTDITAPFEKIVETGEMTKQAVNYRISSYHNIPNDPESVKAAIYGLLHTLPYMMPDGTQGKAPLMSAFPVYSNFKDSYDDGIVPMPSGRLLGGHSSPIFGWKYIDDRRYWVNFGSWGSDIADDGVFYLPFDYPFYPNDWWLMKVAPTPEPPKPKCIWEYPNWVVKLLNHMSGDMNKYYRGMEVK